MQKINFILLFLCPLLLAAQSPSLVAKLTEIDTFVAHKNIEEASKALENINVDKLSLLDQYFYQRYTNNHYLESDFSSSKAIHASEKMLLTAGTIGIVDSFQTESILTLLYTLYATDNSPKAIEWQNKNLKQVSEKYAQNYLFIARLYIRCSESYNEVGDIVKADDFRQKAISMILQYFGNDNVILGEVYFKQGYSYYSRGEYKNAIIFYEKALPLLLKYKGEMNESTAQTYSLLGEAYAALLIPDKALSNQLKANELIVRIAPKSAPNIQYYLNALGAAYVLNRDDAKAKPIFEKVLELNPDFEYAHTSLAMIYLRAKTFDLVHHHIDKAWKIFNYQPNTDYKNIKSSRRFNTHLLNRVRAFQNQFEVTKDDIFLAKADEVLNESQRLVVFNINRFPETKNKKRFYNDAVSLTEMALSVDYQQFKLNSNHLKLGLERAEFAKSFLLYQTLKENRFLAEANIPSSLKAKDATEKTTIEALEKQLHEQGKSQALETKLFEQKEVYEKTRQEMMRYCKNYYAQDAYEVPNNVLQMAQQLLDEETTLLDFTVTNKKIHLFIVQKNQQDWVVLDKNFPLDSLISEMRQAMLFSQNKGEDYSLAAKRYVHAASLLYQKIIAPIADKLKQKVIIVPDKTLAALPFDALIVSPAAKVERFHQHQYLLQKHSITYCNSVTLLQFMKQRQATKAAQNMLAVAPFYDNSSAFLDSIQNVASIVRNKLGALPFSGEEAYKVAKIMNGKVLISQQAVRKNVVSDIENYRFLHFATHGKANFDEGDYSYLAFSPIGVDKYLYAKDIYNLNLNKTEMVVLSACESGIGELQFGEGAISIARAFAQAGAKSILTTLWAINDEKTKDIMVAFYQNLKQGMDKSRALQQAKIQFLNSQKNENAHPAFWAAFILNGDEAKVE